VTSAAQGALPAVSADPLALLPPPDTPLTLVRRLTSRMVTLCWVELRKIRHDRTELYTRAIQPALWLLIYGEVFTRIHAIPTPHGIPYLAYLAPGILAQSALFIAIFYGIQIIWERDAGVLTKLMVTPTPRAALITGKAFAAGVRSVVQAVAVLVLSALLGVTLTDNPLKLLGAAAVVVLGSAFFSCLSMTIAGIALSRDRLMGIGQAITSRCSSARARSTRRRSCRAGCRRSASATRCRTRWTRCAGCLSVPRRTSGLTWSCS
jgi:ABC-2 type transport system permease protein